MKIHNFLRPCAFLVICLLGHGRERGRGKWAKRYYIILDGPNTGGRTSSDLWSNL